MPKRVIEPLLVSSSARNSPAVPVRSSSILSLLPPVEGRWAIDPVVSSTSITSLCPRSRLALHSASIGIES